MDHSRAADNVEPLVIVGPTASGKSAVAMGIAEHLIASGRSVELVSADSMQVYRGMDIGTAKPSPADQQLVPHHLIDVLDPTEEFSVAEFVRRARLALGGIRARGALAIVVGGTGLYVQALLDDMDIPGQYPQIRAELEAESDTAVLYGRIRELDPDAATRIEPGNRRRIIRALEVTLGSGRCFSAFGPGLSEYPPTPFTVVGIDIDRETLTRRIRKRLEDQVDSGFIDEVVALNEGQELSRTAAQALGYGEILSHSSGRMSLAEALDAASLRTRQFAIRQIKWFRRDPRIRWFSYVSDPSELVAPIQNHWFGEC